MTDGSTGVASVDTVVVWSVAITAIAGLLALFWRVLRSMLRAVLRIADRLDQIWDDWAGTPARPGVPERPGVLVRISGHDDLLADHEVRLTRVEGARGDGG